MLSNAAYHLYPIAPAIMPL